MRLLYCYVSFTDRDGNEKPLRGKKKLELNFSATDVFRFEKGSDSIPDALHRSRRGKQLPEQFWANGMATTNIYNINVIAGINGSGKTTEVHYLIDLLNYIYHGFGRTLSEQDRRVRHDPFNHRNLLLFDTEDGFRILDFQNNQTRQGLHLEGFQEPPRFLDREEAEKLLQEMKVVYLTNTLTQRDYELHVGVDENERLGNNFIFDATLGATIGPEVGQFFTSEVYKQVNYLFDPIQFKKRKKLEETIPELLLPRALRLRPLVKPFEKELNNFTGQEHGEAGADSFSRISLPVQLALLCAASYVENMISLTGRTLYIFPQRLRIPELETQDRKESIPDELKGFIDSSKEWFIEPFYAKIVSGSSDKTLRVWDADSGQSLQTLKGHSFEVNCVDVLPDGHVVSGSSDNTLQVWDPHSGQPLLPMGGNSYPENCVAVLSNGRVVSGSDNILQVWDVGKGQSLRTLKGHTGSVDCVAVLPDGRVVSGSSDNTLRVWDVSKGECLQTLEEHTGSVYCVAVLPDGRVVSGSSDKTLRVWDASTGKCLQTLKGHTGTVYCVAVLPDGHVVSGSSDKTLRVWDAGTGNYLQTLKGHTKDVKCVAVLPDGRVVSGSSDKTLRVWDVGKGECLQTLEEHTEGVKCVAVLPDGRVTDSVAKRVNDRAKQCREYIEYVLNDPDKLFLQFEQPDRHENIYELPIPQDDGEAIQHVESSLVEFLKKYHNICTPYYTLDFNWGLSSGEENMLRLFSWLFHIFPRTAEDGGTRYRILNNPKHIKNGGNECDSVLLIMDEADLTFHPEWQRRLIHILTAFLPTIYPPECAKDIQLVLTTHSPLLLGDVPRENIRFLNGTGESIMTKDEKRSETFGQNIHTILKDSFFLKDGTIGQFASNKINTLAKRLGELQKDETKSNVSAAELETIQQTIDLVASGILRTKLECMYKDAVDSPDAEKLAKQAKGLSREARQWLLEQLREDAP